MKGALLPITINGNIASGNSGGGLIRGGIRCQKQRTGQVNTGVDVRGTGPVSIDNTVTITADGEEGVGENLLHGRPVFWVALKDPADEVAGIV